MIFKWGDFCGQHELNKDFHHLYWVQNIKHFENLFSLSKYLKYLQNRIVDYHF